MSGNTNDEDSETIKDTNDEDSETIKDTNDEDSETINEFDSGAAFACELLRLEFEGLLARGRDMLHRSEVSQLLQGVIDRRVLNAQFGDPGPSPIGRSGERGIVDEIAEKVVEAIAGWRDGAAARTIDPAPKDQNDQRTKRIGPGDRAVLKALKRRDGTAFKHEIAALIHGISERSFERYLTHLVDLGAIDRLQKGSYAMTEKGREMA